MNEQELVFKVHWVEKLKMVFKLIYIPLLFFREWRFSLDFSINEIFFKCFLTVLLSIIIFLILSIFVFNKKIEVLDNILTYYERGKEVLCVRIEKDNIRILYEKHWSSELKHLSVDYYDVPIYLFGKKNCLKLEKIICKFQLEKKEIENIVFEISKKELFIEKYKDIFKNAIIIIIFIFIVVKYRMLKIFGNNEKKIYTLITSKNSEFKNEDYETFYGEIVKFCIVNGIEYELV